MSQPPIKNKISFQTRVLTPVVLVLGLLVAATTWLVNYHATRQMEANAVNQFEQDLTVFKSTQEIRTNNLVSSFRTLVNEPRLRAVLSPPSDAITVSNFLDTFVHRELAFPGGPAVFLLNRVNDAHAPPISETNDPHIDPQVFQSQSWAAITLAFQGSNAVDTIRAGQTLLNVVSLPVYNTDGTQTGVATLGEEFGAEAVREMKSTTGSEIFLLSDGQVLAASVARPDLYAKAITLFSEFTRDQNRSASRQTHQVVLNDRHYYSRAGYLPSLNGVQTIGYLLLSPYDSDLAALRSTQSLFLAAGVVGMVLATGIIWLLIRRATQPLRELRDSAEAVGRGDFTRRVEISSADEVGELAVVFNEMTGNLKTSREALEKTVETLKATQNQLIQSEKLSGIGEFVAGVAHELNNPLTTVMGFTELLQMTDCTAQQRHSLDLVFKSARRCQKIVQNLLSFARRHAPERKVMSLNEVVELAMEIMHYQMRSSGIEVETQLDPKLPPANVDPHQLQQVFVNIINNARQAMEGRKHSRLRIITESSDGRVRAIFRDNGPGIPPENLKLIFNPFFTTKEVGKGTGLGLSLCYGIVSEHGGTIIPRSAPGEGATFIIELPAAQTSPAAAVETGGTTLLTKPASALGGGKRVLVIDDEDAILQMIREALTRNGYKVDIAHDGESGLLRLKEDRYDLALCDWRMPGLNGQQVYERLQAINPEMSRRMVFITGDVVNDKNHEFLRSHDKICLAKPFTLAEFHSAISQIINHE